MTEFYKCRKPDCFRKVKPGLLERGRGQGTVRDRAIPLGSSPNLCHSQSCEERSAERGECAPLEAVLLVQPGVAP